MQFIDFIFPPAFILFLGALTLPFLPRLIRQIMIIALPILTLLEVWNDPVGAEYIVHFAGFDMNFLHFNDFTLIFANAFCLAALVGGIFSLKHHDKIEITAAYIYASCAVGITFAGDFLSLFIMWEIMAVASTIVILKGKTDRSRKAAFRYAIMHFFGGALFLASITAYYHNFGTFELTQFSLEWRDLLMLGQEFSIEKVAVWAIFIAILINTAAPPFSSWLADAYPESSPWGGVFLSAFTTKTAVFVLLTIFAGKTILIYIGLFMVFYGIIMAMLENNLRRILSYSIINQVGFMVTGIGIGTPLALVGVACHAFCHIMYKALLFCSAGSVVVMTGKHKCSEVGGLYRTMKFTTFAGIVGALAISAFPYTSGFISKSLITSSAAYEHMFTVWILLLAASAGVFLHAGVKFPWFAFFQKDSGLRPEDPPLNMRIAMWILILLCLVPGVFPQYIYGMLPYNISYNAYTPDHIVYQLQVLMFAGLAFFMFLPAMKRTLTITLDWDWFTRVFIRGLLVNSERVIKNIWGQFLKFLVEILKNLESKIADGFNPLGPISRTWKISDTVFYTTTMLGIFLILYYFLG
jgi:multicomponent Na+:H+ antiporter subunit D